MTDRERLILDITKSDKATNEKCKNCTDPNGSSTYCGKCACEQLADNLLADGWIRPPCNCAECKYLKIVDKAPVFAECTNPKVVRKFLYFEEDTRKASCEYAEKLKELGK